MLCIDFHFAEQDKNQELIINYGRMTTINYFKTSAIASWRAVIYIFAYF